MVENPLRKVEDDHAIVARTHCIGKCHFRVTEFLETLIQVFLVFQKFTLHHFPFMKDLRWHLCSVSEKFEEDFHLYGKKKRLKAFRVHYAAIHYRGSTYPEQTEWPWQAPSPEIILCTLASSCLSSELYLYAFVLYFDLVCASLNKIFPELTASSLEASLT